MGLLRLPFFRNVSIFPKLVLTFLIITTPVFALSLMLNELGKEEVKNQISRSTATQVHYYFSSLEKDMQQIIMSQQEFINDDDIHSLSNLIDIMTDYEQVLAIERLYDKIKRFKNSNSYIKDISIYMRSIDQIISTSNSKNLISKEEIIQISKSAYSGEYPLIYTYDRLFLNLYFPSFTNYSHATGAPKPALFIMNIELSIEALRSVLDTFHKEGGAALLGNNWAIGSNMTTTNVLDEIRSKLGRDGGNGYGSTTSTVSVGGTNYIAVQEKSLALDTSFIVYLQEESVLGTLKTYKGWSWVLIIGSLIMVVLLSYSIYLFIHRPLRTLVKLFNKLETGNFDVFVKYNRKDEFGYLYKQFYKTVKNLKALIDELYVQKIRLQQSELKQLQAQINPHFLYNSFFILHRMIKRENIEKATLLSKNLGGYFQYVTKNVQHEVPMELEVNHVRSYVEIQNIRFSNRIQVEFETLPNEYRHLPIPRLILQPIVENAYEHGFTNTIVEGKLFIGFAIDEDRLCIIVEDNGPGLTGGEEETLNRKLMHKDDEEESTGLINVHRRLLIKYGPGSGIRISTGSEGGMKVQMFIPIESEGAVCIDS